MLVRTGTTAFAALSGKGGGEVENRNSSEDRQHKREGARLGAALASANANRQLATLSGCSTQACQNRVDFMADMGSAQPLHEMCNTELLIEDIAPGVITPGLLDRMAKPVQPGGKSNQQSGKSNVKF